MARTNNTLRYGALCVGVVAAAFGIGYFVIGGPRAATTEESHVVTPPPTPVSPAPAATALNLSAVHPRLKNGDFTAPGAPPIKIVEQRTPLLIKTARPPRPASDTNSDTSSADISQQTPPPPPDMTPADTGPPVPASGPSAPPPTPADTDYEQVGSGQNNNSSHPDSEASQEGGKAAYRVQTGSFAAAKNARVLADALRNRGYVTSTRAEQEGGKTVYKVQIGAYRTKAAADRAAQDLQKDGYPAYSSPTGP